MTFQGPIATRMSDFSDEYMTHIEHHLDLDLLEVPDRILRVLRSTDDLMQGFQLSQLGHGLQTATLAEAAGAEATGADAAGDDAPGAGAVVPPAPAAAAGRWKPTTRSRIWSTDVNVPIVETGVLEPSDGS